MRKCVYDGESCALCNKKTWECSATAEMFAECAVKRIEGDNAVCICGCPHDEHENMGEEGEQCEHEEHVCIRVAHVALEVVSKLRAEVGRLQRWEANVLQDNCENAFVETTIMDVHRQALHDVAPDHPLLKQELPSFGVWEMQRKKIEELEKDYRRWQDGIRDAVVRLSGAPEGNIDGGGCESGDPLDFTLAEVELGFAHLDNTLRQRTERAEVALKGCSRELSYLVRQIKARPGGSVDRAYQESLRVLAALPADQGSQVVRESNGQHT